MSDAQFTFTPRSLPGLILVQPTIFRDDRGLFMETWSARAFAEAGLDVHFVQESQSCSARGVLRGLHFQRGTHAMGKLVRCTAGRVFDVAVDIRAESATFGQWESVELSADNRLLLWIPAGFAHGFQALADGSEVQYKSTAFYTPAAEGSIAWNDPDLAIPWPIAVPTLSSRDAAAPRLRDCPLSR